MSQSENPEHPYGDVDVNQVWQHKGGPWRQVRITGLVIYGSEPYAQVRRNTSRRKQPIKLTTLRREYRLMKIWSPE